ncbi:MAG: ester cyclase [Dehalococcoidia bacterium]
MTTTKSGGEMANAESGAAAVVRRWLEEGRNGKDPALIDELFSPDVEVYVPPGPPVRGIGAYREGFLRSLNVLPDLTIRIDDIFAAGNKVATRLGFWATVTDSWMGIPAAGKRVEGNSLIIWRIEAGKIREVWDHLDHLSILAGLGVSQWPEQETGEQQ